MKSIFVLLFSASVTFAQVVPGRYVLELAGDPAAVAAQQGARPGGRIAATVMAAHRTAVRQLQGSARTAVAARGGTVIESLDTVFNGLIVNIPDARATELLQIPGAVKLHAVRRVQHMLNHALPLHKVPDAWSLLPLGQNGAGAGIKIGMIDSGVDVNNPAFSDPLPPVDGFPKVLYASDTRFTNAKVIVAKNYTRLLPDGGEPDANDRDGHGTGTSVVAAGGAASTPYGPITGVAPKAYIGNYKVLDANGGTSDVVAKAIDDAVADGMDVLNISLGSYVTSYSDIAADDVGQAAIARATQAGVIVVVAAGNTGPGAGTIGDLASAPDAITLGAIHNDRSLGNAVTIDGVAPYAAFPGNGPDPGQVISGTLFDVTGVDSSGLACSPLPSGSVAGKIVLVLRGTCTFADKLNDVAAGGALAIIVYNNPGGNTFSRSNGASVGTSTLPAMFVNQSEGADLKARVAQDSGVQVALDFRGVTAFAARTDVSSFSSRGPSVGSALKPDLAAVGEEIVTGAQNSYTSGESYSASGFIDTAGTSFSTPLAAGAAAVLKGARPGLTVAQYRSLLINGAATATAGEGVAATMSQAGAGILNLAAAVGGTVAANPTALSFGAGATLHSTVQLSLSNVGLGRRHLHDSSCSDRQRSGAVDWRRHCVARSGRHAAGASHLGCFGPDAGRILRLSVGFGNGERGAHSILVRGTRCGACGHFDSLSGLLRFAAFLVVAGGGVPRNGCGGAAVYGIPTPAIRGKRSGFGAEVVRRGRHSRHVCRGHPHRHGEHGVELHYRRSERERHDSGDVSALPGRAPPRRALPRGTGLFDRLVVKDDRSLKRRSADSPHSRERVAHARRFSRRGVRLSRAGGSRRGQ